MDLSAIFERGKLEELDPYFKNLVSDDQRLRKGFHSPGGIKRALDSALSKIIQSRMAHLAIKNFCLAASTGVTQGKIRFSLLNGLLIQKLLFSKGLERKPVSLFWFKLLWPFIGQKRLLMPLVQPKGVYCFYSRPLVDKFANMIGNRICLEIAAGDGTLARFLNGSGVRVKPTDNYGWGHSIQFPQEVMHLEAREALSRFSPEVVICSWPPVNNPFERQVFKTSSVKLYIVIGSIHEFAAGNWQEYRQQSTFSFKEDKDLSRLVLPPELESAVYVFERKND